jgi:Fe-S-cluster containining protein
VKRFATLDDLYAAIPPTACKGLCWESCIAGVRAHPDEHERMRKLAENRPTVAKVGHGQCRYLTLERRCSVYEARPLICRLYGAIENSQIGCEHGCCDEPLVEAESFELMKAYVLLRSGQYEPI